ncbi:hypothetical protein V9K67_14280 [Paraflavisolibacter sp. H34]
MKRILPLFLLLFSSSLLYAQVDKGRILLGANLSFGSQRTSTNGTPSINSKGSEIDLSVGKAIRPNVVAGILLGRNGITNGYPGRNTEDTSGTKMRGYSTGVFFRPYKDLGRNFSFFTQAAGEGYFRKLSSWGTQDDQKEKTWGASLSLEPGLAYTLNRWLQVELSLPGLVSLDYFKTKGAAKAGSVIQLERSHATFTSSLTNGRSLSTLGIGFRFLL